MTCGVVNQDMRRCGRPLWYCGCVFWHFSYTYFVLFSTNIHVVQLVGLNKTHLMFSTDLHRNNDIKMQTAFRYILWSAEGKTSGHDKWWKNNLLAGRYWCLVSTSKSSADKPILRQNMGCKGKQITFIYNCYLYCYICFDPFTDICSSIMTTIVAQCTRVLTFFLFLVYNSVVVSWSRCWLK